MPESNSTGISREEALGLLSSHIKNEKTLDHSLASEAIMRKLARRLGEDEELWGMAGLLHDLDYEITGEDMTRHGLIAAQLLKERGANPILADAVAKHNAEGLGLSRSSRLEHALVAAESITGMIIATALVYPDKKIASVKPKSVTKRMKTPQFARAISRERICECEKIGIALPDFAALSIEAMGEIADQFGL